MQRTILSVAYPLTEVGTDAVGGSEQILALLDRAITAAGHRSLVIAAEGSRVEGTLIPSPAEAGPLDEAARRRGRETHASLIREVLNRYSVDLVHMHSLDFHQYLPPENVEVLATLHLPPDWYPARIFDGNRAQFHMNCVSHSQHQKCRWSRQLLEPICNGVDVERLSNRIAKRNFALAMGRICPEKSFHFALDAAKDAGTHLMLAGEVFPVEGHNEYFEAEIAPRLDRRRRFIGPVRFGRKRRLLAQAKCLLIPSTVAETSSLVAMESLACGTPVIAFGSGALPEIIDHGKTGFIVSDAAEMALALRNIDRLDPEHCRRVARSRFSAERMGKQYLELYERLIAGERGVPPLYQVAGAAAVTV